MSEQIPDFMKYSIVDFEVFTPTVTTKSDSLKVISRPFPTHQYMCRIRFIPLVRNNSSREASAWLESIEGRANTLLVKIPNRSDHRGALSGVITVNGNHSFGDRIVNINTGLPGDFSNAVLAGDPFVFAGHSKVYTAKNTVNANANGTVDVELTLPLLKDVSDLEAVTYDDVLFKMRQTGDVQKYKMSANNRHVVHELDLEEEIDFI